MMFSNGKFGLSLKYTFIFLSIFVPNNQGLNAEEVKEDNALLREVDSDDTDLNLNEHLESSIKNVKNDFRTNALKIFCRMQTCSDWTTWSRCSSIVGRRGTRSRTRECGYDVKVCKQDMLGHTVQSQPCIIHIPWCPLQYNYTRHGFCVKLYKAVKSWYDAQIHCESDGGNLINIDTETLSDDIDEVFGDTDFLSVYAWIDGIRRASGKPWVFRSGLKTPMYSNWQVAHPSVEAFPSCKCVIRTDSAFEWRISSVCGNRENFICQIKN